MKKETLMALAGARAAKRPMVLATLLDGGDSQLFDPQGGDKLVIGGADISGPAGAALRADRATTVDSPVGPVFLNVFNPPLRMLVIGAVHITQPLVTAATLLGFDVTVIDPRTAFATKDRFPGIKLRHDWPDEAMAELAPDARTAVVTLTHDPKIDDPALIAALGTDVFYIGALGSRRTHAKRVERLTAGGIEAAALARIHAPVGLAIKAKSPAEIAISIVGEVIATLRGQPAP